MNYTITREDMKKKMERALHSAGDYYSFEDLMAHIESGHYQSFVQGNTWIITQVNEFPRRRELQIVWVIGDIDEAVEALPLLEEYAKKVKANRISAVGREGWWGFAQPGWNKVGVLYAKDI